MLTFTAKLTVKAGGEEEFERIWYNTETSHGTINR